MGQPIPSVETILAEAVEIDSAEARRAFVEKACAGDASLRQQVERLIVNHFRAGSFLESPVVTLPLAETLPADFEGPGTIISRYRLLERIGEGGFGVVFMAEQLEPVRRKVALKILRPGMDTREIVGRFEAERQALALMDHPHIARVLDGGATESGRPFFVMELVRGMPITQYCDQARLSMRQRLELFVTVCQAVQHAHTKGIIHRDIKPSNVMVTLHDGVPVPKVIDFGVAKAIDQQLTEKTVFTRFAQMIGTPLYMSPEQAALSGLDVDTRSDLYSLGVLLYELLTGATPFDSRTLHEAGYDEMRRIIREDEPPPPSRRLSTLGPAALSTVAQQRGVEVRHFRQLLRGELDWIVMQALEKDRTRRYQTARGFAADVQRYLDDEPVEACPPSALYRLKKLARRHKAALATVCLVAASLLAGTAVSLWQAADAIDARRLADARLKNENQARREVQEREARLRLELYATDLGLAWQLWNNGDSARCLELLERQRPREGEEDLRGFEWHYLRACCQSEVRTIQGHESPILTAAVSPDDRLIASGDRAGTVKVWDLDKGRERRTLGYSTQEVSCVRFSPDGRTLATAGQDRTVRLWDVATWTEQACLRGHDGNVCSIAWSPDGRRLVSGARDHAVKVWDTETRQEIHALSGHTDVVRCVVWSPDGRVIASAGGDRTVRLWEAGSWRPLAALEGHGNGLLALAFSHDGRWLASGGYGGTVIVFDVAERTELLQAEARGNLWSLAFSPDDSLLVAGTGDGELNAWKVTRGNTRPDRLRVATGQGGKQRAVLFAHQGATLIAASEEERKIKVSGFRHLIGRSVQHFSEGCYAVDMDRGMVVTEDSSGNVHLRDLRSGRVQTTLAAHTRRLVDAVFSPPGDLLATSGADNRVCLWDTTTWARRHAFSAPQSPGYFLAFSPNGTLVAAGSEGGEVRLWNVKTGVLHATVHGPKQGRVRTAFSPDGTILATATDAAPDIRLWDAGNGNQLAVLPSRAEVYCLTFSPDGKLLATAEPDNVTLWDMESRRELPCRIGQRRSVVDLAFSPDGRTLATFSAEDRSVALWNVPTQRELFTLLRHPDQTLAWFRFTSPRQLVVATNLDHQPNCQLFVFDAVHRGP